MGEMSSPPLAKGDAPIQAEDVESSVAVAVAVAAAATTTTATASVGNAKTKKGAAKKKKTKAAVKYCKAPQAPKRFKSAFIFYTMERHKEIRADLSHKVGRGGDKTPDVAKLVSGEWRNLPKDERAYWEDKARLDKERFEVEKAMYTGPWKVPAKKKAKKDPSAPKRPMSSFLSFSNAKRSGIKEKNPGISNTEASKVLARMWKEAPEEEKREHIVTEAKLRRVYKIEMAAWREKNKREEDEQRRQREQLALDVIASKAQGTGGGKLPPSSETGATDITLPGEYAYDMSGVSAEPAGIEPSQHKDSAPAQAFRQIQPMYPSGGPPPMMYGQPYPYQQQPYPFPNSPSIHPWQGGRPHAGYGWHHGTQMPTGDKSEEQGPSTWQHGAPQPPGSYYPYAGGPPHPPQAGATGYYHPRHDTYRGYPSHPTPHQNQQHYHRHSIPPMGPDGRGSEQQSYYHQSTASIGGEQGKYTGGQQALYNPRQTSAGYETSHTDLRHPAQQRLDDARWNEHEHEHGGEDNRNGNMEMQPEQQHQSPPREITMRHESSQQDERMHYRNDPYSSSSPNRSTCMEGGNYYGDGLDEDFEPSTFQNRL